MEFVSDSDQILLAAATPLPPSPTPMEDDRAHLTARRRLSRPPPFITASPSRSNVVLSDFWANEPRIWFKRTEAIFRRAHVTSSHAKYDHVPAKLPNDILVTVFPLMDEISDSTPDPYERLRSRLLDACSPSKWTLANRLIHLPPLGDQKPSALMDKMLSLLPSGEPAGILFQTHFLNRLPEHIRDHLASRDFADVRAMAAHADRLWAARQSDQVTASLAALQMSERRRSVSPAFSRRSSPGRTPYRRSSPPPEQDRRFCHFHRKFGAKARICRAPCEWQQAENASAAGGL